MVMVHGGCIEPGGMELRDETWEGLCPRCRRPAIHVHEERCEGGSIDTYHHVHCTACGGVCLDSAAAECCQEDMAHVMLPDKASIDRGGGGEAELPGLPGRP